MDGLSKTGQVSGVEHTRDTQEAHFKGYSVEIGRPAGVSASEIPDVHIRSNRSLLQMVCDTVTDLVSGSSVGTTKETRKLDAMIEYIKTGEGYNIEGGSDDRSGALGSRLLALEQVLRSPLATPSQKNAAVGALEGAIKKEGVEFHGREVRSFCSQLASVQDGLTGEKASLLDPIKHALGQQILKADTTRFLREKPDTPDNRLSYLNDYRSENGDAPIAAGIDAQIEILESAIKEQKSQNQSGPIMNAISKLDQVLGELGNQNFDKKLSAIKEGVLAYAGSTGLKGPQAGKDHDTFVADTISSLKDLYQDVLGELMKDGLSAERGEAVRAALQGLRNLADNIVNTPPEAGSTLVKPELGYLQSAINSDLKNMGFSRKDSVFLGSTQR